MRNEPSILHIYPVGQKFRQNRSISHGLGGTSNFKFYHFCQKFKVAAIFGKRAEYLAFIPCGPKISPKLLYLAIFFGNLSCLDTLWDKNFAKIIICELFVNTT